MYITNNLIDFVNNSSKICNSTILLTDFQNVVFVSSNTDEEFLHKELSCSLKEILNLYKYDGDSYNYLNTSMDSIVPITANDCINEYKSQIILPIVCDFNLEGLLIFMTKDRKYLPSNLKYAKTTKHFVELLIDARYC